ACPGVRTACPSLPRRARRRDAGWAWVVSLLVAGPAAAGDGRAPGLLDRLGFRKAAPPPAARPAAPAPRAGAAPGGEGEEDVEDRSKGGRPLEGRREAHTDGGRARERPRVTTPPETVRVAGVPPDFLSPISPPLGFTGRSSIVPRNDPTPD